MTAGRTSAETDKEWFTPPDLADEARTFLRGVALDPCGAKGDFIAADKQVVLPCDGLSIDWNSYRSIWCNPPYGRSSVKGKTIRNWLAKCAEAARCGSEVLALVPVATNTTHWFQHIWPSYAAICFFSAPRFKFIGAGSKGAPMAVCLIYWGADTLRFARTFGYRGNTIYRAGPPR